MHRGKHRRVTPRRAVVVALVLLILVAAGFFAYESIVEATADVIWGLPDGN